MKINDIVNSGFKKDLPIFMNMVTIIDYSNSENKIVLSKKVSFKKYKMSQYNSLFPAKPICVIH
jgi:hypothetical protein